MFYKGYILLLSILSTVSLYSQDKISAETYTYKKGDYSGIGKWYMGREIAYVMGYQGIGWLERPEREYEENTSKLIRNLDIQPNDVIADIGAGSGYHVFKMAPLAKNGKVYAVDIQKEMLNAIQQENKTQELDNIVLIQGTEKSTNLPEDSIDKILMVDVYHEFSFPIEMLASMKKALKPNGEIYLIEYRAEDDNVPMKRLHKMSEKQAIKEFEAAGFKLLKNISNLPWQHCMIFIKS
ncbi:class I SAM-dependent methyltransferase [Winogradskyella jejuensis]|uniref:Methyltransferase domain-containing protein n=1 Tax=Winogradskyella jejuensis TaxID=1089305 RepID=A0A1M5JKS0_9FLAO|nr:class I SAM-dependent methyltransferase [Winogradskyella jejuensis]SHG41005.1 Methyltransferase domain-containing protein [Winogradskyella jejuensis]